MENVITKSHHMKTKELVYVGMFAALIAVCSWISIPTTVPFTLQTLAVFVTVGLLGGKLGSLSIAVYILLGMLGLPVFSGFTGGIGKIFGPTGGYIVGFLFSALYMWALENHVKHRRFGRIFSMLVGLLICYLLGTVWFYLVYIRTTGAITLSAVLMSCVVPFIIPDCLKILAAEFIIRRVEKSQR